MLRVWHVFGRGAVGSEHQRVGGSEAEGAVQCDAGDAHVAGAEQTGATGMGTTQSLRRSILPPLTLFLSCPPTYHCHPTQIPYHCHPPQSGIYRCPVYKILTRTGTLSTTGHSTNFVTWIEVPSKETTIFRSSLVSETNAQVKFCDQDYWIKAGVACFCALRY